MGVVAGNAAIHPEVTPLRLTAVAGLAVLALLTASVGAQSVDDKLIVPGQRIGKWTLEATLDDLDRINGQGVPARLEEPGFQSGILFRAWPQLGLLAAHRRDQSRVEALILSILMEGRGMSSFTTAEGIGILSKGEEVLSAYRRPSRDNWLSEQVVRSVYDPMGIAFLRLVTRAGAEDKVVGVYVFRPDAARSIWR